MDIKVNVREHDGKRPCSVVDLNGEIDVYTSPKVKETISDLIDEGHYALVINLENVRYIDSTGLGVLIGGLKRVREHSGAVNFVCTNPQIKKIFDITGLVKIFGIYDSEARACESLMSSATARAGAGRYGRTRHSKPSRVGRRGAARRRRHRQPAAILDRRHRRPQARRRRGVHKLHPARRRSDGDAHLMLHQARQARSSPLPIQARAFHRNQRCAAEAGSASRKVGGLGVFLIRTLMDDVTYEVESRTRHAARR